MRLDLPSATPLFIAAGLCVVAIIASWPEPLSNGWEWPSLMATGVGILISVPFWRPAQDEAMADGKSGLKALFGVVFAGVLVVVTLLHMANVILPASTPQEVLLTVTDKYVRNGRRSRRSHYVVTTPVPGDTGTTRHRVGGLHATSGGYTDYQVGSCMALRWRVGLLWPVIIDRRPASCAVFAR